MCYQYKCRCGVLHCTLSFRQHPAGAVLRPGYQGIKDGCLRGKCDATALLYHGTDADMLTMCIYAAMHQYDGRAPQGAAARLGLPTSSWRP